MQSCTLQVSTRYVHLGPQNFIHSFTPLKLYSEWDCYTTMLQCWHSGPCCKRPIGTHTIWLGSIIQTLEWAFRIENVNWRFQLLIQFIQRYYYYYYYYWYSALGLVWAETRAQSGDWYGSGTLHPGQVLRGSLPLLSPSFRLSHFTPPGASTSATTWEIPAVEVETVGENVVR